MRKQIPLIQEPGIQRDAYYTNYLSKVPSLKKNGYMDVYKDAEDQSQRIFFCKRPGIFPQSVIAPSPAPAGSAVVVAASLSTDGNGSHFIIYSDGTLANTSCYFNNALKALPGTWAGNKFPHEIIQLQPTIYANNWWAFTNGAEGALVDATGAIAEIVDVDYTAWGTKSNFVALDGYLFQADFSTGYIYNSDLNTPSSWTATGRIQASIYPGMVIRLGRIRNYLVAFKSNSIEFFENTGQPTPGSPLTSAPQFARKYGCARNELVTEASDGVIWVGFDPAGKAGVFKMSNDTLAIEEISNSYVSQILQGTATTGAPNLNPLPFGGTSAPQRANTLVWRNKELILIPVIMNDTSTITLVYDNQLKDWGIWTAYSNGSQIEARFPSNIILRRGTTSTSTPKILIADATSTTFGEFSEDVYADWGWQSTPEYFWISDRLDFGTGRRKYMNSVEIQVQVGWDGPGATQPHSPTMTFSYSDADDGTLYSQPRSATVSLVEGIGRKKMLFRRLGSFYYRRLKIGSVDIGSYRIGVVEVDYDMAEDDIN